MGLVDLGRGGLRRGHRRLRGGPAVVVEVGRRPEFLRRRPLAAEPRPPRARATPRRPTPRSSWPSPSSTSSLKARKDANAPDTDLGLVNNACDLAIIQLETNKPADALALLDPIAKKLAEASNRSAPLNSAYSRVLSYILRAHVATGKVDLAIADMKTIEAIGGAGNSAASALLRAGPAPRTRDRDASRSGTTRRAWPGPRQPIRSSSRPSSPARPASRSGRSAGRPTTCSSSARPRRRARSTSTLINTYGKDPQFLKGQGALRAGHAGPPQAGRRAPDARQPLRGRDPAQRDHRAEQTLDRAPDGEGLPPRRQGRRPSKGPGPRPTTTGKPWPSSWGP